MVTILSKDIQSLIPADKVDDNYTVKRKILWGSDGIAYDVTLATPLPVQIIAEGTSGWSNFGQNTPTQIQVTSESTLLLAYNASRVFVLISNNSSQRIFIQYGNDAVFNQGLRLMPGASLTITSIELFLGVINAITDSGSVLIDVIEGVV